MQLTAHFKENTLMNVAPLIVMETPGDYEKKVGKKSRTTLLKRIPLDRLMDLKIDYAFKQLFGNEKNKEIMIVFLNAVLQKTGRSPIKDISLLNIEAGGEYIGDKQSRLDLLVKTDDGENINVEIQFTNKYDMIKRSIYYWSGIYRSPLQKSMNYSTLNTVISINILNFNLFDETERFHTMFHLYEDDEKFKLTDLMEFHYIEMSKLIKAWKEERLNPWNDVLARWLMMLGMVDRRNNHVYEDIYKELEEIAMNDESLKKAFKNWEELSMTQEEFLAYESRLKRILDEESAQREAEIRIREAETRIREAELKIIEVEKKAEKAKEEGVREGEERGLRKGRIESQIEIARRLLEDGMGVEVVRKITELPIETITEIKSEV